MTTPKAARPFTFRDSNWAGAALLVGEADAAELAEESAEESVDVAEAMGEVTDALVSAPVVGLPRVFDVPEAEESTVVVGWDDVLVPGLGVRDRGVLVGRGGKPELIEGGSGTIVGRGKTLMLDSS